MQRADDEHGRKIHVEIKPLNNGSAPMSASVDELRATVGNLYLCPVSGGLGRRGSSVDSQDLSMKRSQSVSQQLGKPSSDLLGLTFQQSPAPSNASTPTSSHPYAPLQSPTQPTPNSPTLSTSSRYAGNYSLKTTIMRLYIWTIYIHVKVKLSWFVLRNLQHYMTGQLILLACQVVFASKNFICLQIWAICFLRKVKYLLMVLFLSLHVKFRHRLLGICLSLVRPQDDLKGRLGDTLALRLSLELIA